MLSWAKRTVAEHLCVRGQMGTACIHCFKKSEIAKTTNLDFYWADCNTLQHIHTNFFYTNHRTEKEGSHTEEDKILEAEYRARAHYKLLESKTNP